jgi:hypothetical protein
MVVRRSSADIGRGKRRAGRSRPANERVVKTDLGGPERVEQLVARAVRSADLELLRLIVELENRPALRAGELHCMLHDRREDLV